MPPTTPNGVITQYSMQYGETVIDNFGSRTLNMLKGTVERLSPDTEYVLQLRAHTNIGPGPNSSLTVKTCKLFNTTVTVRDFSYKFVLCHLAKIWSSYPGYLGYLSRSSRSHCVWVKWV